MDLYNVYKEQVEALVDGGVDIILFETTSDTLNVKAGLEAAEVVLKEKGKDLPIMLSLTLAGQGGRTLSGQTLMAFWFFCTTYQYCKYRSELFPLDAADMKPYLQELAKYAPCYVSAYPNAGLQIAWVNTMKLPKRCIGHIKPFVDEQLINIIGGCCGTTPAHIARYPELVKVPSPKTSTQTGLPVVIRSGTVGSKTGE